MQNDPIGDKGGSLNWYSYVANNPINFTDISGFMGAKPPNCCPEHDRLQRELDIEQSNLSYLSGQNPNLLTANLIGGMAGSTKLDETVCITGIRWPTLYNYIDNNTEPCLHNCVDVHEGVHWAQCWIHGNPYPSTVKGEIEALKESIKCLLRGLR